MARAKEVGPNVAAPQWALMQAMSIVRRHYPDPIEGEAWQRRAALECDVAEALYGVASRVMRGKGLG